ncbi:MAG: GntR family transcriptional regulator [Limnochordaceae bacterium]|nr:GntR family transcriptional regulator [Limnochordaceae bacterium]
MDVESPRPIYLQIIDEVKRAMARRDLLPGDRIPSQRELAQMLRVNPNTVQRAFREMEVLGLVETVRGEGTFVRDDPALLSQVRSEMAQQAVAHFVKQIRGLGFAEEEAVSMVRAAFRQSEPEGDRSA